jgi:hypothetical protein
MTIRIFYEGIIPDLIRNLCSSERDDGRIYGRGRNVSGDLQPIDIDSGSSPGVTEEEGGNGPRVRHPGLDPGPGRREKRGAWTHKS